MKNSLKVHVYVIRLGQIDLKKPSNSQICDQENQDSQEEEQPILKPISQPTSRDFHPILHFDQRDTVRHTRTRYILPRRIEHALRNRKMGNVLHRKQRLKVSIFH